MTMINLRLENLGLKDLLPSEGVKNPVQFVTRIYFELVAFCDLGVKKSCFSTLFQL